MDSYVASQATLLLEANFKVFPQLLVGAYGVYGRGGVTDAFEASSCRESNCSAQRFHFGAQVQYHPHRDRPVSPWVGYGLGYEILTSDGYPSTSVRGFELARLMVGLDFRPSATFGLGPFIDATLAGYTRETSEQAMRGPTPYTLERDSDLTMRLHSWITIGVRALLFP